MLVLNQFVVIYQAANLISIIKLAA